MVKKIQLEFELMDLEGVDCLFKVGDEVIEGSIIESVEGYVKISTNCEGRWFPEDAVDVVTLLFRD